MLSVHVLGTVRAYADGREISLGGMKQEQLLACLLVTHGLPVSPNRLIDDLWGDDMPRDPAHALQARISRLRAVLPVKIELLDRGYRIDPATVEVDFIHFEQLSRQAGWLIAEGMLDRANRCLKEGLGLWHGQPFADHTESHELRGEAMRLEKLYEVSVADHIDLELSCGRHREAIPAIHALITEHPLRERAWGQLMTALYMADRPHDALEVFAQARETFSERLGVEPNGALSQLNISILEERPAASLLRWPTAISTEDATAPEQPRHLPVTVTSNQADQIAALAHHHRALILTGAAGMGKTHLLRAVKTVIEAGTGSAPLFTASELSRPIPLGIFAGAPGTNPGAHNSAARLIDFFVRHRSLTVLLIDNVDKLDETSLFVVTQLIRVSRVPVVMALRELTDAPTELQSLYDSGDAFEVGVDQLSQIEAEALATDLLGGGRLTPAARPRLVAAADGNPLQLRELITGSLRSGRLVQTEHGWDLHGPPSPTSRLSQLFGERFEDLDATELEAVAKVAIAGELPADALELPESLARRGFMEFTDLGWVRLVRALDVEIMRSKFSSMRWRQLTHDVVQTLRSEAASARPQAQHRACLLALDLSGPLDVTGTLALAEHALGGFDERLAHRAARAVIDRGGRAPNAVDVASVARAHRIAGQAASALGLQQDAVAHFEAAKTSAATDADRAVLAIAHSDHVGIRCADAAAALEIVREALGVVGSPGEMPQLELAAMRWSMVAGQSGDSAFPADTPVEVVTAGGLITAAMGAVISGPLSSAERALVELRRLPAATLDLVPGGAALVELTEVMALSNTGDVAATCWRLQTMISTHATKAPERVGLAAYALGFSELLSGDAEQAHRSAHMAVEHLEWRDLGGLLPAARALLGATLCAAGDGRTSEAALAAIPPSAESDPKVMMLRAWASARQDFSENRRDDAASSLLRGAHLMLTTRHTFFAGMLAHCVVRLDRLVGDAVAVIDDAAAIAGGGMLELVQRHGRAVLADDGTALEVIAHEAEELGLMSTAADSWHHLSRRSLTRQTSQDHLERFAVELDRIQTRCPHLALWSA